MKRVLFSAYTDFKREVRKAKRNYWREFCNRIGEEIEVWNMIRKMEK